MDITLFGNDAVPSVRAVLLTLNALNLRYNYVDVNLFSRMELEEEFYVRHPRKTIPTFEDGDYYLYEPHAIIVYLVERYAESDDLYPKDLLKRAQVEQRLYFESGAIYLDTFRNKTWQMLKKSLKDNERFKTVDVIGMYDILEEFLKDQPYIAGDKLTIADFCFISSVITFNVIVSIDPSKYEKLTAWIQRIKELPYWHMNMVPIS